MTHLLERVSNRVMLSEVLGFFIALLGTRVGRPFGGHCQSTEEEFWHKAEFFVMRTVGTVHIYRIYLNFCASVICSWHCLVVAKLVCTVMIIVLLCQQNDSNLSERVELK
jgi:hypothetical protein